MSALGFLLGLTAYVIVSILWVSSSGFFNFWFYVWVIMSVMIIASAADINFTHQDEDEDD